MSVLRVVGELPLGCTPERAWAVFARVEDWPEWDRLGSLHARLARG